MKRIIAMAMALILTFGMVSNNFSVIASAASNDDMKTTTIGADLDYYEVVVDRAPIRTGASQDDSIITRCAKHVVLPISGSTINYKLNKWYRVDLGNGQGYIYSGNVEKHVHSFVTMESPAYRATFKICRACSYISVTAPKNNPVHTTLGLGALGCFAAALAVPTGGISLAFAGAGAVLGLIGMNTSAETMKQLNWDSFMANQVDYCRTDSAHIVTFDSGRLYDVFSDNYSCIDEDLAFVYAFAGGNIWVQDYETARSIAYNAAGFTGEYDYFNGYDSFVLFDSNCNTGSGHIMFGGNPPAQR